MSWILTSTGKHFDFVNPLPEQIDIIDIANGLSRICRFSGQCREFYSVAQHSIRVSQLVPGDLALEGLLHDAAEAYCQDLPTPLKALLPDYQEIERRVQEAIQATFGLPPWTRRHRIEQADLQMLATERRDLMPADAEPWEVLQGVRPVDARIAPMDSREAFWAFICRYNTLISGREWLQ